MQVISAPNTIDVIGMDTGPGVPPKDCERLAELVATLQPEQQISVLALDHRSGETGYVQAVIDWQHPHVFWRCVVFSGGLQFSH